MVKILCLTIINADCAHAAFPLPSATEDTPPRESIELRALVFTYPEEGEAFVATGTTRGYTPDRVEGAGGS